MSVKTSIACGAACLLVAVLIILIYAMFAGRKLKTDINAEVQGLDDDLKEILTLAALSPGSHNTQAWITDVYPADRKITLQIDDARALPVVDPDRRELYISLGCYAETLMQAFDAYGYDTEFTFDETGHLCTIQYHKNTDVRDDAKIALIRTRHTDKRAFDNARSLDKSVLDPVLSQSPDVLFYANDTGEFATIKAATLEAYTKQAYDAEAAKELSGWLRLSDAETLEHKDGLPAELLGIDGIKKTLYYAFTGHESATGETFAKQGIDSCSNQLDHCGGFLMVTANGNEAALVRCGMETVRIWLKLTGQGISVHPMSYALEDADYKSALIAKLGLSKEPQMLLRVGYTDDYGENAQIRRDLAEYVKVHA